MKQLGTACLLGCLTMAAVAMDVTNGFSEGPADPQSMSALAFGPEGILLVGDSVGARLYAIDLDDRKPNASKEKITISDIETKFGALLGVDADEILIHDMAVNPISQNIYFSVSRGRKNWTTRWDLPNDVANANLLLRVSPKGEIDVVSLAKVKHAKVALPNPIHADAKHPWKKSSPRVDAVTDLAYHDGKVYVAGLSNEEFASTMRVFPFPFKDQLSATTLEIFHGAHGKYETQSPIRAFTPYLLQGQSHLLASYLCTPLVTFPLNDLRDKQHVKGATIAELGYGNYPLDMLAMERNGKKFVLLANNNRGLMMFKHGDIENHKEPIVSKTEEERAGVPYQTLPFFGILQMDYLNEENVLLLSRKANGKLDLDSLPLQWISR